MTTDLQKVTIERSGDGWQVKRERKEGGEAMYAADLEEAFFYVRSVYDMDGKEREDYREWLQKLANG